MANKKISELPYINVTKISGNTLVPLVTYFSAATGDTVHTYANDLKSFITSGISGNFLPLSGGTVSGGTRFLSGLTANTISATTYFNLPSSTFSGGTVTGPTIFTNGLTANTISATTYQNLPTDIRVTGATYSNNTFTYTNNTGGTFSTLFNTVTGLTVNGGLTITGNTSSQGLTATTISATTYQNLPTDIRVTGGTYSAGTISFTNNTGGTFNVTGLTTGSTSTVSGNFLSLSGGTVTGNTSFTSGLTSNTISATTYQNLPVSGLTSGSNINVSGSSGNFTISVTGLTQGLSGDYLPLSGGTVTGNTIFTQGITATTISATTYQNLPTDIRVTGVTNSNNTFTFTNNTGGTFSTIFNTVTGLTINGNLSVTGNTNINNLSATTISATTYQNLPDNVTGYYLPLSGGTVSGNTVFLDITGTVTSLDTTNRELVDSSSFVSMDWQSRFLIDTSGIKSVEYGGRLLNDGTGATSVDWENRLLYDSTGTQVFNWESGNLDVDYIQTSSISATTYLNLPAGFTGDYLPLSGGTVTGNTIFTQGITATTISATTYQNLPTDIRVTGATYSNNTFIFTNNTGGTFSTIFNTVTGLTINGNLTVTGNTSLQSLTATTISATTYQNLPTDIRVTGVTNSNNTFTFTNNTGGTFSTIFNTVTGLTVNGGLTVTGNTSLQSLTATTTTVNGNLTVTGNTNIKAFTGTTGYISGSGQNILTVIGSGNSTTSPLFTVQGSSGELFSVNDSLVGSLFSVNDISGLPILEVFSDNTTLMGSYQAPSLNTTTKVTLTAGTNTVYSIPTSAYTGAFIDYTLVSTGTTGARAGNIMTIWSGTSANFTETQTTDIGTTTGVTFTVAVSGSNAVLSSSATTTGWTLKTIVRSI